MHKEMKQAITSILRIKIGYFEKRKTYMNLFSIFSILSIYMVIFYKSISQDLKFLMNGMLKEEYNNYLWNHGNPIINFDPYSYEEFLVKFFIEKMLVCLIPTFIFCCLFMIVLNLVLYILRKL